MKNELFGYPELFTPIYACCVPSGFIMFTPADGLLTAVAYSTTRWFTGGVNVSFISCPAAVTAGPSIVMVPVMYGGRSLSVSVTPELLAVCGGTTSVKVPVPDSTNVGVSPVAPHILKEAIFAFCGPMIDNADPQLSVLAL